MLHHGHILLLVIAKGEEIVGTFYEKHKSEFRISKVLRQKKCNKLSEKEGLWQFILCMS